MKHTVDHRNIGSLRGWLNVKMLAKNDKEKVLRYRKSEVTSDLRMTLFDDYNFMLPSFYSSIADVEISILMYL